MAARLVLLVVLLFAAAPAATQQTAPTDDPIQMFVAKLEKQDDRIVVHPQAVS